MDSGNDLGGRKLPYVEVVHIYDIGKLFNQLGLYGFNIDRIGDSLQQNQTAFLHCKEQMLLINLKVFSK